MSMCFCQTGRYKEHFVCFACRKMFKKTAYTELPPGKRPSTYEEYRPTCPQCRQPMHNLGKEFEPPKQSDLKAWRKAEQQHQEIQQQSMASPRSWIRDLGHS
jgi:hypothetical protein